MLDTHLRPVFGEYRSDRLTHAAVSQWAHAMADAIVEGNVAPKYYNNLLNLLHSIVAWARHPAQGYLAHDPLVGEKRLPKPRVERDFLEPHEIELLLEHAIPPHDTILHLAVFTGLRRGELFALRWGDIDWGGSVEGGDLGEAFDLSGGHYHTKDRAVHTSRGCDATHTRRTGRLPRDVPAARPGVCFEPLREHRLIRITGASGTSFRCSNVPASGNRAPRPAAYLCITPH